MTHRLEVFQSLWAMERRRPDGLEWSEEEKFERIAAAGFHGVCFDLGHQDTDFVRRCWPLIERHDLDVIFNAFPRGPADFRELAGFAASLGPRVRFISIIGKVIPWRVDECAAMTREWLAAGAEVGLPVYVEIHRNCMTNDLLFTLQLMDAIPELMMTADLSHALVNQEWYLPLPDEAKTMITRFLARSESFQGRVASREQVQVALDFPQHRPWVELFEGWWREGFASWRARHADRPDDACVFLCELGPPPYAITGRDGYELSDRWEESLVLKATAERLWAETAP
ncbi:MAG: sugar phosphate isomerase/epimerase [Planctomycetes bacterium]|nr:sugar phosphate isomerase/epimerase [Planctomycetota bacterium]